MYTQIPIVVFNRRLGADRREVYLPTVLHDVSYWEQIGVNQSSGVRAMDRSFKFRVPVSADSQSGKSFVPAETFDRLEDTEAAQHWTLHTGDYVMPGTPNFRLPDTLDAGDLQQLGREFRLITITDYADNTLRGSAAVQHYRIGGR